MTGEQVRQIRQASGEPRSRVALTSTEAMAAAVEQTGLDDFGIDDFADGIDRSLDAFASMPLTAAAYDRAIAEVVNDLANRLRIEEWYRTHPELATQVIDGPVLVIGLPRTGTTATVAMLALDSRYRFLRAWEALSPIPPPIAGQDEHDPRAIAARDQAKNYPLGAMHLTDPDGPEEDLFMLAGLAGRKYHGSFPMPDEFMQWWINDDFASTYRYHERALRLLQSSRPPNRWLLKSPPHIFKLEAFLAQYPNAQFIMTHRDPCKVIGSLASFNSKLYEARLEPGQVDKAWTGRRCLSFWADGMRQALAARDRIGDERFIDVYNTDVVRDPIATIEMIYDRLGTTIDSDLTRSVGRYHAQNQPGQFGEHRYSAEEFGLTDRAIRAAFADYIDRFSL